MTADAAEGQAHSKPQFIVAITPAALHDLSRHALAGGTEDETGGILLGHDTLGGCHIIVAGDPGPRAVRTPTSFSRDLAHAERLADTAWHEHRAVWLGEWHTHVHVPPIPSDVDMSSYLRHLDDVDLGFDRFISIIIGSVGVPDTPPHADADDTSTRPAHSGTGDSVPTVMTWIIEGRNATAVPLHIGALP